MFDLLIFLFRIDFARVIISWDEEDHYLALKFYNFVGYY